MPVQIPKFVLESKVFAYVCTSVLSSIEAAFFMKQLCCWWQCSASLKMPFAASLGSVLNSFPLYFYNTIKIRRLDMIEESKDEQKLPNTSDQPSNLEIHQQQKPSFFNHMQGNQDMPISIWFCILAASLKILPIVLFFTLTGIKILGFTLVLIAASIDFWTLKNISGRELVGMIWWMKVNVENGDQEWIFHSNQGFAIHKVNEAIFWGCLLLGNVFWAVTTLLSLILSSLFWISLCAFCFLLSALNFYCFMKCQGQHRQKIKDLADKVGLASAHRLVDY